MVKRIRELKNKRIDFYRSKTGNLCYVVKHNYDGNLKVIYNHTFKVKVITDNNYRCRVPKFSYCINDTGNLNYRRYKKALNTMYQPDLSIPVTDKEKEEMLLGCKLLEEKELLALNELQRRRRIHMIGNDISHLVTPESIEEDFKRIQENLIWYGDVDDRPNGFRVGELFITPTACKVDASYKTSIVRFNEFRRRLAQLEKSKIFD